MSLSETKLWEMAMRAERSTVYVDLVYSRKLYWNIAEI